MNLGQSIKSLLEDCANDGCTPAQATTDVQSLLKAIARRRNDEKMMLAALNPAIAANIVAKHYKP
jgi:hypothetical protein